MTAPLDSRTFVAGLVAEMQALFARLGEQGALEAESQGRVEIVTLLRLALISRSRSTSTSASSTTRAGRHRSAGPTRLSTSATSSAVRSSPTSTSTRS